MIFNFVMNGVMLIASFIASFLTLKAYVNASFNKIDSLHWGISFTSLCIYILIFNIVLYTQHLYNYYTLQAIINSLHFIEIFAITYMLGVSIRLRQVQKNRSNKTVRYTRVVYLLLQVIILSLFIFLISYNKQGVLYVFTGSQRLHLLNNYENTIIIQYLKGSLLFISFILMPSISYYLLMKLGLLLIALSEILQALNIQFFNFSNEYFLLYENVFSLIGILSGTLSIIIINQLSEKHEVRIEEKRKESSTFGLINKLHNEGIIKFFVRKK